MAGSLAGIADLPKSRLGVDVEHGFDHAATVRDIATSVAPVEAAADGLLAHLSLLFVPLGVGVIAHLGLLGGHAAALALVVLGSTLAGLGVTGLVLQALWPEAPGAEAAP